MGQDSLLALTEDVTIGWFFPYDEMLQYRIKNVPMVFKTRTSLKDNCLNM